MSKRRTTSHELLTAAACLPADVQFIVSLEKSCRLSNLNYSLRLFTNEADARKFFEELPINEYAGYMKHLMSREAFRRYAVRVYEVRVGLNIDQPLAF